jgi:outer membrane protein OmpA-like peptidoglycan-associated protein
MDYKVNCIQKKEKGYGAGFEGEVLQLFGISLANEPLKMIYCDVAYMVAGIKAGDRFFVDVSGNKAYVRVNRSEDDLEFVETNRDSTTLNNLLSLPACGIDFRVHGAMSGAPVSVPAAPGVWQTIQANPLLALFPFLLGLLLPILFGWFWKERSNPSAVVTKTDTVYRQKPCLCPPCPVTYELIGQTEVRFNVNKYGTGDLQRPSDSDTLKKYVALLTKNTALYVDLFGYADNTGGNTYNDTLSSKREISIKKYLVSKGVDESRIKVQKSYGKRLDPDKTNSTLRAEERKVEIRIYGMVNP